jgi:hypothetical protein
MNGAPHTPDEWASFIARGAMVIGAALGALSLVGLLR